VSDVVEIPCPTLADDLDNVFGVFIPLLDLRHLLRSNREETEYQNDRYNGEECLDRHVVAQLHRQAGLARAATVREGRPDCARPYEHTHAEQHNPRIAPARGDALGVVGRVGRTLREKAALLVGTATRKHEGDTDCRWGRNPFHYAIGTHRIPF